MMDAIIHPHSQHFSNMSLVPGLKLIDTLDYLSYNPKNTEKYVVSVPCLPILGIE
jgi:hypothetical protein